MTTSPVSLQIGQAWSLSGQASQNRAFYIRSASNTSPIIITTTLPHGYSDGDKVAVAGCIDNAGANTTTDVPSWTIDVIDPTSFSLTASTGTGAGGMQGGVSLITDYSAFTGASEIRAGADARFAPVILTPAFSWLHQNSGWWNLSLTEAQSLTANLQSLFCDIFVSDGNPVKLVPTFSIPINTQVTTTFN